MTEKQKHELVSGLVDDQMSEIEIHQLLRRYDEDARLSLIRYQQVRAVVRKERLFPEDVHLALSTNIQTAIADEPAHTAVGRRRQLSPLALGMAAAASFVLVASVAVFFGTTGETGAPAAEVATTAGGSARPGAPLTVSATPVAVVPAAETSTELRALDAAKQQRLRAYLNRHDRMSRMNPNARVVNFENPQR